MCFSSVVLEEEIWRLQEENDKKEEAIIELRERAERRRAWEEELQQEKARLEEELGRRVVEVEGLKGEQALLEEQVQKLTGRNVDTLWHKQLQCSRTLCGIMEKH